MKLTIPKGKKEGHEKIVTKFLLIPVIIGTQFRWMERATVRYKVTSTYTHTDYGAVIEYLIWLPQEFI